MVLIRGVLEHYLETKNNFIELVVSELGIRLAKVGPGMHVIRHDFYPVSMDVVIQAAGDGMDVVISHLAGIERFPFHDGLEFFWDQKITSLHVITAGVELREKCSAMGTDVFVEILGDQIEGADLQPGIEAIGMSFIRAGESIGA